MQLLLIDDDPLILKVLEIQLRAMQLRSHGYHETRSFADVAEAVAHLQSARDDVGMIFCDLQMPQMDGIEFIRHLAQIGYRGDLILISGEDRRVLETAERLARSHALRVRGVLQKPIWPDHLRAMLAQTFPEPGDGASPVGSAPTSAEDLQSALADGHIVPHFQPKVDLRSGALVGVEALARWMRPSGELVYPAQFIPTAESSGLIVQLADAVIDGSLRQARAWQDEGLELEVAINLAMGNLDSLEFPDRVVAKAGEWGVSPNKLVFEITETQLMNHPQAQLDAMTRLRLKGARFAIDDFGTGYSCLSQLTEVPFDEMKIDQRFVHRAASDPSLRAILDVSLGLAQRLDIRTVAEGVEDRADWDFIRAQPCDLAQGHFIGRPMPGDRLAAWRDEWVARWPELGLPA
jgi:EAL domain-containing protein (putative c-di-GMP-specific phosphodiesterase class I)/ActR/RegA family two-component response regulator